MITVPEFVEVLVAEEEVGVPEEPPPVVVAVAPEPAEVPMEVPVEDPVAVATELVLAVAE